MDIQAYFHTYAYFACNVKFIYFFQFSIKFSTHRLSCVVGGHLKLDLVAHDVGAHLLAGLHLGRHNHLQLYRGGNHLLRVNTLIFGKDSDTVVQGYKKSVFIIVTFEHLADVESFHFLVQALP